MVIALFLVLLILWCCFLLSLLGVVATMFLVVELILDEKDIGPTPGTTWKLIKRGALL
jgi:hypothetical protein